ncbi:MAG: hypothetical protein R3190_01845, partial [Thermoanaerobaculia bacterium]|nr:hypothetical protein [Thermoanaerobaculia bacterium]
AAGLALALWAAPLLSQSNAPIYPSYDGWVPNEDGSFTLVFGYHSENSVPVTVPAGPDNGFVPGPDDRGQPVVLQPGRHRNACLIVVGPEFEGKNLQWRIGWAGKTVATTERGGPDPLYRIEEINAAYRLAREIDTSQVERGVCINTPPTVFLRGEVEAEVGAPAPIQAFVNDDGLPRGSTLSIGWKKLSGPGEVTFRDGSTAAPTAIFAAAGEYEIEVTASDGVESRSSSLRVRVSPGS